MNTWRRALLDVLDRQPQAPLFLPKLHSHLPAELPRALLYELLDVLSLGLDLAAKVDAHLLPHRKPLGHAPASEVEIRMALLDDLDAVLLVEVLHPILPRVELDGLVHLLPYCPTCDRLANDNRTAPRLFRRRTCTKRRAYRKFHNRHFSLRKTGKTGICHRD
jgi:hypothetical protein